MEETSHPGLHEPSGVELENQLEKERRKKRPRRIAPPEKSEIREDTSGGAY